MRATTLRQEPPPLLIGERVNAQGSRAVKRLLTFHALKIENGQRVDNVD